jgi:hypothetical protein
MVLMVGYSAASLITQIIFGFMGMWGSILFHFLKCVDSLTNKFQMMMPFFLN